MIEYASANSGIMRFLNGSRDECTRSVCVLNVMAAGIKCGSEIELICEGEDEQAAMDAMSAAIESGLGEL